MATLTISSGTGQTLFSFPLSGFRAKDDTFDPKSGGSYIHRADTLSATECNEWQSLWYYMVEQLKRGGICIDAYANVPLVPGPVAVVGYQSGKFLAGLSDAGNNVQADAFAQTSVISGSQFFAQFGCIVSGTALNTTAAAVGSTVWLGTSGSMTLAMPTQCQQVVGYTLDQLNSGYSTIAAMPLYTKFMPILTSGLVVSGSMGDGAVVSGNIASGEIGQYHIGPGGVYSGNLAAGSVISGSIASGHVGGFHLSAAAVASGNLAAGSVLSGNVASGHVGASHLAANAVASGHIADGAVVSGDIASGQIGLNHIGAGGVTSGKIAAGSVTSGNIASGAISSGTFSAACISSGSLCSGAIASGNGGNGCIVSGNVASGHIGASHLANLSVSSGTINSGAVGWAHINPGTPGTGSGTLAKCYMTGLRLYVQTSGADQWHYILLT